MGTLDVLLPALLRGLLVGLALVLPGVFLHAMAGSLSQAVVVREGVFDLSIGLLVVAPAAVVERLVVSRRLPRAAAEPITLVAAFVGAAGAFLQGMYADAVLSTGSLDAGLEAVTEGAGVLPALKDLLALFAAIALVVTVAVQARLARPERSVARQVSGTLGAALTGILLLTLTPIPRAGLAISGVMLVTLAVVLPSLAAAADALVARAHAAVTAG